MIFLEKMMDKIIDQKKENTQAEIDRVLDKNSFFDKNRQIEEHLKFY